MDSEKRRELPSLEWFGNPPVEDLSVESLTKRGHVATAAKDGNWAELLDALTANPGLVNSIRPGGDSWFTPLHQAAYHNAPEKIVLKLIALGAFRTLINSSGERPVDIARKKGFDRCADLLEPVVRRRTNPAELAAIQELFHGLVRAVSLNYSQIPNRVRLPELSVLTEIDDRALWFPISGMYGGFNVWLEEEQSQSVLVAESWSRVVGGSGMRHRITPKQVVLVDEGFV